MRKTFILVSIIVLAGFLTAQNPVYEYSYDAAGNRIRRAVVPLHKEGMDLPGAKGASTNEEALVFWSGVRVYPNPTTGTVRLETSDTLVVGDYRLFDARGLLLDQGRAGTPGMTLDLSGRVDGIYLLDVVVGTERRHFRIIKQ
jgi:hypothetical protein